MSNDNNDNKNKIRRRQVSSSNDKPSATSRQSSSKSSSNKKKSKKKDKFKYLRITGILILVLMVIGVAGGTGLVFASLKDVKPVTKELLDEKTYQTTKIYYATGDLLSNAPTVNKKEPIKVDQMPKDIINAIVAIEDERFFEHKGVDIKGLMRSVIKTLLGDKQGGSTIPMQVSKMLLTTDKQTVTRKIKDIYYAYEMSKTLTKNDILEVYLNNFHVGKSLYGVEAGAHGYFDKKANELTLAESALLAGSTKNPSRYTAYNNIKLDGSETKESLENKLTFFINTPDDNFDDPTPVELDMVDKLWSWKLISSEDTYKQLKAGTMVVRKAESNPKSIERRNTVLSKMLELGYISQADYDEASVEPINIKLPKKEDSVVSSVEDLIEYRVIDALVAQGNTRDEAANLFYNGGLEVKTTIDPKIQDNLEDVYDNDNNFPGSYKAKDGSMQPQSSMVILDYRTGQIKALVGGRHITGRKTLNRATTPQQPGSTIKPLSVFTPAIDTLEITQSTAFSDVRGGYMFNHGNWNPRTTTAGTGSMSLRKAFSYSSNTITIKAAEMLGATKEECIDLMLGYLKDFGISTLQADTNDRSFAALTLGGLTKGVSPLEMAAAYGTLANGGVYIEPTIFTTITAYDGTLLVKSNPEEHKVVDPEVAYVMTDMLQAVVNEGIGGKARLSNGMPVAGKTGTTNASLDVWFVGYTPYYVGATYIGEDAGRKDPDTGNTIARRGIKGGSGSAATLWSKVMNKIHANLTVPNGGFKAPDNIYFTKINLIDGGKSPSGSSAAFIKGTYPKRVSVQAPKEEKKEEKPTDENVTPPETPIPPDTGGGDNPTPPDTGGGDNPTPPDTGGGDNPTPPDTGGGGNPTPPDTGGGGNPTPPDTGGGGNPTPPDTGGGGNPTPPDTGGGGGNPTPPDTGGGGTPAPTE